MRIGGLNPTRGAVMKSTRRPSVGRLAGIVCTAAAFMIAVGLNFFSAQAALNIGLSNVSVVMLLYAAAAAMRSAPSAVG